MATSPRLLLGLKVDHALDPEVLHRGLSTLHEPDHWVSISARAIAHHTAIVAQSGSGKSFFLGRFVEEILLRTRARCLVLDANGDFLRVAEVAKARLWTTPEYSPVTRKGTFTHERSRAEFLSQWEDTKKQIRTAAGQGPTTSPLQLHWTDISAQIIAADYDKQFRHEIINCHRIVQSLGQLHFEYAEAQAEAHPGASSSNLLLEAEALFSRTGPSGLPQDCEANLSRQFDVDELVKSFVRRKHDISGTTTQTKAHVAILGAQLRDRLTAAKHAICKLLPYVSQEPCKYYFRRSHSLTESSLFSTALCRNPAPTDTRLDVVDLSSISDQEIRQLTTNAILATEWRAARNRWREAMSAPDQRDTRVPTFLVVDEAHNFIPIETRSDSALVIRDQFRTIASEGRKYGLFVVAASQRPDKLDPLILSECDNKVIMRIGSESVLRRSKELLGLEDVPDKTVNRVLDFPTGRGLLAGSWIEGTHEFFCSAARRTIEGGRNLDPDYWAAAVEPPEPVSVTPAVRPSRGDARSTRRTTTRRKAAHVNKPRHSRLNKVTRKKRK